MPLKRSPIRRTKPLRQRKEGPAVRREAHPVADEEVRVAARQKLGPAPTVKSLHVGRYGGTVYPQATKPLPKLTKAAKVRQDIRDSAKGEDCTVRIPGCWGDVIWSHYRGGAGGKALGSKAICPAGAYACLHCDQVYDGQAPRPAGWTKDAVDLAWHEGHIRSLVRLAEKGLL